MYKFATNKIFQISKKYYLIENEIKEKFKKND